MINTKRLGLAGLCLLFGLTVSGCKYTYNKTEYSELKNEKAEVVDVVYAPERHGSDIAPTLGITPDLENGGFNPTFAVTRVDVDIPEEYAVVFKCQHGKFIEKRKGKDLWNRLQEGQTVDVDYREVYETTYEAEGGPWAALTLSPQSNSRMIGQKFIKYQFIDAQPAGENQKK